MRRLIAVLFLLLALPVAAQIPDLPGLENDAAGYRRDMERRFPTGGSAQQRVAAENRATAAERANNWAAAATAWEERVGMGEASAEQLLSLARAQLARTPPENARALQAAWLNFFRVPDGLPEIPSLLLMAQALQRLDRVPQQLRVLEAVVVRAPNDQRYVTMLADARRAAGVMVSNVTTNAEAEPASACIGFTVAPSSRADWQPADWVRADPAIPGLAVTREGGRLCVAGLPHGRTTQLVLRAGMPGEDGLRLVRDTRVPVAMPNRQARIAFDTRRFILARGQQARVGLGAVNLSALELQLVRVVERSLVPALRSRTDLAALEQYESDGITESFGRVVWEGRADLPAGAANTTQRVILPLPDMLRTAGPGLYMLVARAGDGSGRARVSPGALPIFVTDLGLTAWRSEAGLAVQARGLQSGLVEPGTRLSLIASSNEILAEAEADADGVARFPGPLLRGQGATAPVAIHATKGDDFVALSLDAASFDLSDRGASGLPHPGPLDAFIWLDRGIFRPGETVNAGVLLRDAAGAPSDVPARLRLRRPNGQVAAEAVPARQPGAALLWTIPLSNGAPAGMWKLEVLTDPEQPAIASADFRVDAFVPERLEVTMTDAGPLVPGKPLTVPVAVRFLYDAPGEGMTGTATLSLTPARSPFAQWPRYEFGLVDEIASRPQVTAEMAATDAQGRGAIVFNLPPLPDATQPLTGRIELSVEEPGGRASSVSMPVEVRAQNRLIGVRPGFADGAVNEGQEAAFEIVALDLAAAAVPATLNWRLVRETPEWRIVINEGTPRYATVWRSEPVESGTIATTAAQPARLAKSLPFGRYRLEVTEPGSLAITSLRFRSGWASGESVDTPDKADVAADRNTYSPGDTARIRIQAPFAGVASVAVLTDRLVAIREVQVAAGGAEVTVPVDAAWGAGAHVAVTVFRPGEARAGHPGRALGLAWLQIDPASRALTVAIEGDTRVLPRQRIVVPVRLGGAAGEARLTLAAVDEGILRLTRFATPDPLAHFTGRRELGVDIRDDYGRLIPPPEGELASLRQGGDGDADQGRLQIPQRNVSLFSGVVRVGADGLAQVPLDIPDFNGELRLMAVAWEGTRIGAAGRALTVRDPLIAEAILPRFLAPGDEARLPLLLHNLDLPAGAVAVTLTAEGAIALNGPTVINQTLAAGQRVLAASGLRAAGQGEGVLRLSATGPGGFAVTREARITVRSSRGMVTEVAGGEVAPNTERPLALATERFVPGSWRASARFGGPVRYDVAGMLRALEAYPLDCTEQASSRVIGLLSAGAWAGEDRGSRLQIAVNSVLNRQRFDGAFSLWSAQGEPEQWVSAYATEALIRAKAAGAAVPETALTNALQYLDEQVEEFEDDTPIGLTSQAYRLHALALGGRVRLGAARRLMENLTQLPTPLARAQLGAAFAAGRDTARAEAAFAAALAAPNRRFWHLDYGSSARDWLAISVLMSEAGVLPGRLSEVRSRIPGPEFTPAGTNTQEKGWALLAASVLGRDGRPVRVALNGAPLTPAGLVVAPLTAAGTMRNLGEGPVWATTSITGIPATALPAGRNAMRVARRFFTLAGQPLNLDQLRTGTSFILQVDGRAEDGQEHQAMMQQGLPAGWEIQARLPTGDIPGMAWLGTLTEPVSTPALDDRVAAAVTLSAEAQTFRLAWRMRATTPGRYELPGAEVADMYRPELFARQAAARVTVLE